MLKNDNLVDHAGLYSLAISNMSPDVLPEDFVLLIPEYAAVHLRHLEVELLNLMPGNVIHKLPEDRPGEDAGDPYTDITLLRYAQRPSDAPEPKRDGTVSFFSAMGEVNEIREVLRRCAQQAIPLDSVELMYTERETYTSLIFELTAGLLQNENESLPVTFSEGIPARYFRPGRALSAWLEWIREGFPQVVLARMIQDGLLNLGDEDDDFSFTYLATILRSISIGAGRDRYEKSLDAHIRSTEVKLERPGSDPDAESTRQKGLARRLKALLYLRKAVSGLISESPGPNASPSEHLEFARAFLQNRARSVSAADHYTRGKLELETTEMARYIKAADAAEIDIIEWLSELLAESRVAGQGPRPGCLFVSDIAGGGHSGRAHTFVVGLDDTRFPGAGTQDPLVLDSERNHISKKLTTAGARLSEQVERVYQLLARLRGNVTLSYSRRDLKDDREKFPGQILLNAYRVISGNHDGDRKSFKGWLTSNVSFAPDRESGCLSMTDWWMWQAVGTANTQLSPETVFAAFPHLMQGHAASVARDSDKFTEFDGYVPDAGVDADPTRKNGQMMSAGRLEMMAKSPLDYFFRYILEIDPPDEYGVDLSVWLDGAERGNLLHDLFQRFVKHLTDTGEAASMDLHWGTLKTHLADLTERYIRWLPPPNDAVFQKEQAELEQIARIFLAHEEEFALTHTPIAQEISSGQPSGSDATALDCEDPVVYDLGNGGRIRLRGRIDRLDKINESGQYIVLDYKTGSNVRFRTKQPFNQGRVLQGPIYIAMANNCLAKYDRATGSVERFGYFFPGIKAQGDFLDWSVRTLEPGQDIIATLCLMISAGCFLASDHKDDMTYSDYLGALGDIELLAKSSKRKIDSGDATLELFARLRR